MGFKKDVENFEAIYNEMALTNLKKIGKWDDKKNRHGYDKASIGILSSPSGLQKLERTFNKIGNWDFNLYFVKLPNAWKQAEKGIVDPYKLEELIGVRWGRDFPFPEDNEVTVIFTNNAAAEKVPLTPWTIAHRIGHAFAATFRGKQGDNSIKYYDKEISRCLSDLMECYGVTRPNSGINHNLRYSQDYLIRDLYQKIGKFRSARRGELLRATEFYHEAFAYWLLHDGELALNPAPETLMSDNKKAWGNPTGRTYRLQNADWANDILEYEFKPILEQLFDYYIGSHIGTVSIM
jgi:hypothetical protein